MGTWEQKGRLPVYLERIKNFRSELSATILGEAIPFSIDYFKSKEALPLSETYDLERLPIHEGNLWGETWESGYFKLRAQVPSNWEHRELAAWLDFESEGLIYSDAGEALYGITNGSAFAEHYSKDVYRLGTLEAGSPIELLVETAANGIMGIHSAEFPISRLDDKRHGTWVARVKRARLCTFDVERWQLYLDIDFLLNLYDSLDPCSVRAARIVKALFEANLAYEDGNSEAARGVLAKELKKQASPSSLSTSVIGHAHIDTAWLWPLRETRRKTLRTFASQIDLIHKYPSYKFGASAAQHYQWVQDEQPALYRKIQDAVAKGHWEIQGGMWVEADCNLISGESMVRQILAGKNFFKKEFGKEVRTCWIPDVFGYPASMPQILRKSGIDYFLTQKMSWSKFNEFPHDSFKWRGIDGSEILTHFPPEYTYNSYANPADLRKAEKTFHEKDRIDEFMTLLGIGDGGGGPKEEHVEHILRAADCESVPRASFGSAEDFFERLNEKKDLLDYWTGELYLEYHRGTYTTQAKTKKNNRYLERELQAVEALYSCLPLATYPASQLDSVIKTLLLLQFHDIIPGSSIHKVYEDAELLYEKAFASLYELRSKAQKSLFAKNEKSLVLLNYLNIAGHALVDLPLEYASAALYDEAGHLVPTQLISEGTTDARLVARVDLRSQAFMQLTAGEVKTANSAGTPIGLSSRGPGPRVHLDDLVLENELILYRFDANGCLVHAFDKELNKELLEPGQKGNVLSLYRDIPHNFEAWDIDFYYVDQLVGEARGIAFQAIADGPLVAGLLFKMAIGNSFIEQNVTLSALSKELTFKMKVEWKEMRRLLRVDFPVDPLADTASCDIQFGYVKRPTRVNTEWDFAKFEYCAHRYVDVSVAGYGIALLNDCKYGYSSRDGKLGLSLLRSPLYPDPDADIGKHEFSYAFLPHGGDLLASTVMDRASLLNRPPLVFGNCSLGSVTELPLRAEGEGFAVETLRKADQEEALILRIVEKRGIHTEARLFSSGLDARIVECDLMEQTIGESLETSSSVHLNPFEIKTFKLKHGQHTS